MSPEVEKDITKSGKGIAGGKISERPFPKALYKLARSRGYLTQTSLARELGSKKNTTVGRWYRGETVPSPEFFGAILRLLKPTDEELEGLVGPYSSLIIQGFGSPRVLSGTERMLRHARIQRKPSQTPLGIVIDQICDRQKITIREFAQRIDVPEVFLRSVRRENGGSLENLADFLEKSPQEFDLKEDEIEELADGVSKLIEGKLKQGKKIRTFASLSIRFLQKQLPCQTYMPVDLVQELGVSRERVRQLRRELGIANIILTEEDRQKILDYREKVKAKTS